MSLLLERSGSLLWCGPWRIRWRGLFSLL